MLKAQYAIMVMCFHPSTSYVAECTQSTFNANAKYFKNIADFFYRVPTAIKLFKCLTYSVDLSQSSRWACVTRNHSHIIKWASKDPDNIFYRFNFFCAQKNYYSSFKCMLNVKCYCWINVCVSGNISLNRMHVWMYILKLHVMTLESK